MVDGRASEGAVAGAIRVVVIILEARDGVHDLEIVLAMDRSIGSEIVLAVEGEVTTRVLSLSQIRSAMRAFADFTLPF